MEPGIAAVESYLEAEFPDYVVRVLERDERDFDRSIRSFEARSEDAQYVLRVVNEVLDLDAGG